MNLDVAAQAALIVFSDNYFEARQKLREIAPGSQAYECSVKGPHGEDLFTDVAYFGPVSAKKLLVLVSGSHGVEGYCGSAAQLLFLKTKLQNVLPAATAVLIIHALNCYGFAWDRRVTAEGVDLNRNFIDFSKPLPQNPDYEELAEYLVPVDISEEVLRRADDALTLYQATQGTEKFRLAYSGGQYSRPEGIFYGGKERTEARRTLEKIAVDYDLASRDEVIILDYHTGLGPYGYGELQCEQSTGQSNYDRAVGIFGASVTSPDVGTSSSVSLRGTQDLFWRRILGERGTYVGPEFGTYPLPGGRIALRRDHWLFAYSPDNVNSELGQEIRSATKKHYYPQALDWKEMVAWRSHQLHRQVLESLASANSI
ncbi:DUF2817 domain-containing protein [Bradyrhizobium sp. CCBAU 11361]|uniref:DUF2817 domain-containing protein n=1 Tax=Bradyrhizobium sp. CCBAU 11361 TaxID=1630812 RepID=UPI00230208EE|nr:DUF2817 domain-containing protein [Bradyrhizobium sp. CCBAU 11361]MDA9489770.1 hypothetical protein [Bradyrhizobium sp. CCBAU 11361]